MKTNLLIDFDCIIPNLALMKISTYLKSRGEAVELYQAKELEHAIPLEISSKRYDRIWISTVFTWNKQKALSVEEHYQSLGTEVAYGGTGFSNKNKLSKKIEFLIPDYSIYPDDERIVGFTQRGCIRKCPWCVVPEKEGNIKQNKYIPISDWYIPEDRNKLLLLDNEFADPANTHHDEILEYCSTHKYKLSITQGYDIRCVTRERTELLAKDKPWNTSFTRRQLYIAWDFPQIEGWVRKGLAILLDYFKPSDITCYVICGSPWSTWEQDRYRVNVLHDQFGVNPYVMAWNSRRDLPELNKLRYWCNRHYINRCTFEDFSYKRLREIRNA